MSTNNKTSIESEIDLDSLNKSEEEIQEDKLFDEGSRKVMSFMTLCDDEIQSLDEELEEIEDEESDEYYSVYYKKEAYTLIKEKFFQSETKTDPNDRLDRIKMFMKSRRARLDTYLKAVNNTVVKGDLDGIEAESKIEVFEHIIDSVYSDTVVQPIVSAESEVEESSDKIEVKKDRSSEDNAKLLSNILSKIDNNETIQEEETVKELSEYEQADLDGKVEILYKKAHAKAVAKDGEPDGIVASYIEDMYNPSDTIYDKYNLMLNLLVVNRMLDFEVMDWEFTDTLESHSSDEINLSHKWWTEIMTDTSMEEEERIVKIVDKNFGLQFYSAFFASIAQNADRKKYSDSDFKLKLVFDDVEGLSREEHFLEVVYKSTDSNSLMVIPDDMEEYINITERVDEELGNRGQITYLGKSNGRHVYSAKTEEIKALKGFKSGVIFINAGNKYVVNPTKPIVFYNKIENPYLKRPIVKISSMGDFKINMHSATVMHVDNLNI